MRWLPLLFVLGGCAYVTKAEFDEQWDKDGDGWPLGEDCIDSSEPGSAAIFPYAPDVRGDGCDADCGKTSDRDGDDWPDDSDCNPDDAAIFPCSDAEVPGDSIDSDCDGNDSARIDSCPGWDPDFEQAGQTRFTDATCPCIATPEGDCGGSSE